MAVSFSPLNLNSKPCLCFSSRARFSPPSSTVRPAVILPGLANNSGDYDKLTLLLKERHGRDAAGLDWLRNAAGLLDPSYWRGTLRPRPVLDWYLKKTDEAVQEAKELAQGYKDPPQPM